jgi:hypothetical protein
MLMAAAETQAATFTQLSPIVFAFVIHAGACFGQSDGMRAGLGEAALMRYAIPAIFKDGFGNVPPILRCGHSRLRTPRLRCGFMSTRP